MTKIKKFFGKIKKFFGNLLITLKVQKGALLKILAVLSTFVLIGLIGFGAIVSLAVAKPLAIAFTAFYVIGAVGTLAWVREDYKEAVKAAATVEVKKANAKAYKARKQAEKQSIKSQNEAAKSREIKAKFIDKEK